MRFERESVAAEENPLLAARAERLLSAAECAAMVADAEVRAARPPAA
jgi:hypothetical protein